MKNNHRLRITFVSICVLISGTAIVVSILKIINSPEYSVVDHLKTVTIKAERGNIYTQDYQLLAVTSSRYELRFDGTYLSATEKELSVLAADLARIFKNKTQEDYLNELLRAKNKKYFLLKRDASLLEIEKIKKINFYKKSLNGGLIIVQYSTREKPNKNSASRTIGDLFKDNNTPIYGLEYSYNSNLMGINGRHLVLHEPGIDRKIKSSDNTPPTPGKDLITTLELDYQDILDQALLRQLENYEATFGMAILMEVKTGKIKAITNLDKTKSNKYAETFNYAVSHQMEPGSTFKLASIMAYLEDFNGNIEDTIDCKYGKYKFKGAPIVTTDSESLGVVSLKEAFAESSNIGMGRLIMNNYSVNPENFLNRIFNFGLGDKSKIDLNGVPKPNLSFPGDPSWSGISLPWMSFGYGFSLTALDILTFYNSVANDGYFVPPYLGNSLRQGSEFFEIERDNLPQTICSASTIRKAHILLREVVLTGTGSVLNSLPFPVSGKTGTAVKHYSTPQKNKQYQSSFAGFFPSDQPKYSCIVIIDSPNPKIGFYGSEVAVPVFKEIANKIYLKEGIKWNSPNINMNTDWYSSISEILQKQNESNHSKAVKKGFYPSVIGMHVREATRILERSGYKVFIKGKYGNVIKQYPKPNTPIKNNQAITLFI